MLLRGQSYPEAGGGGIAVLSGAHLELTDARVDDCSCGNLGSAVHVSGAGTTAVLKNTQMARNWAGVGATAVAARGASMHLDGCLIVNGTSGFTAGHQYFGPTYGFDQGGGAMSLSTGAAYVVNTVITRITSVTYALAASCQSQGYFEVRSFPLRSSLWTSACRYDEPTHHLQSSHPLHMPEKAPASTAHYTPHHACPLWVGVLRADEPQHSLARPFLWCARWPWRCRVHGPL